MAFLYPSFLWALLALAIPIIIHLFYFRRFKKVYFTNVKQLEELKEETSSRSRIKNLLILLSRLLAMAALVFAFAQPYIPQGDDVKQGNNAVSLFVDNSFSMNAENEGVPLIDIAKQKARDIIAAYGQEDRFQILTHDFEPSHQRLISKDDAVSLIDEINTSPSVKTLDKVIARQQQALFGKEDNLISYLLTDFQESITDFSEIDSTLEVNLMPIRSVQEDNISIDSVWLDNPVPMINQTNKLVVRVSNWGKEDAEGIRLSLLNNGQEKPEGTLKIAAGKSVIDTININLLRPGWHRAQVKISDYPVQFDDVYHVALNVPERINVLAINNARPNRFLTALFNGLNLYDLSNQNQNNVDYGKLSEYDLIILNDLSRISSGLSAELITYTRNGGNILVFPSSGADLNTYNNFLNNAGINSLTAYDKTAREVNQINTDEFVFSEVYQRTGSNLKLPKTTANYTLSNAQRGNRETLLRYRDGTSYLDKYTVDQGRVYVCTSPFDKEVNDLVLNAEIFVPMLFKMAIATDKGQKIAYTIGKDDVIEADKASDKVDIVYEIVGEEAFIPGTTNLGSKVLLSVNNQISKAGYYDLVLDEESMATLAYNYDRRESNLAMTAMDNLSTLAEASNVNVFDNVKDSELTAKIGKKDRGIVLWKWCLILALLFLLIETLLLRLLPNT